MFKVLKSHNPAIKINRKFPEQPAARKTTASSLGTTSKGREDHRPQQPMESTSSTISMKVAGSPNTTVSGNAITIDVDPMLTGMTPQTEHVLHSVYRDIYYNDPVGGSAVDLMSMITFGEFTLGGLATSSDGLQRQVSQVFNEAAERLSTRTLMPEVAIDYLVTGAHCGSLIYNKERRVFTDIFPHSVDDIEVTPIPFYSQEPLINVKFPDAVKAIFAKGDSPRIKRLIEHVGPKLVEQIKSGSLELDPLSTIFIPRRTFTKADKGTSYFRRLLPIYLIEKNLFRGTLIESARRQRGILHLSLGDGDSWIPTVQDMEFMTELFMNADSDPIGAIIATRVGVQVDELRQGGDFWKSTDFADSVLNHKLRALGISEGFLSGDANFNTADQSLTVFLEMIRSFRDMITRKFFYDKLFPLISLINGFTLSKSGKIVVQEDLINTVNSEEALYQLNDGSKLFIPTVHWTKQLKPEGDSSYMDMLTSMSEKGVPVPLRVMAAAGGLDLDQLVRQQDEDLAIRKKIAEYADKIAALAPKAAEGDEASESSGMLTNQEHILRLASRDPSGSTKSSVIAAGGRRKALLNRDFGEASLMVSTSKTGKPKHVFNQARANERVNRLIAKAAGQRARAKK
jgi:hypothetical protein